MPDNTNPIDDYDNPYRAPQLAPEPPPVDPNWLPPAVDGATAIYMEGLLTAREWKQAARLHGQGPVVQVHVVILVAILCLVVLFFNAVIAGYKVATLVVLGSLLVLVGLAFFIERARRAGNDTSKTDPVRRIVSATAVRGDTPNISSTCSWAAYSKYKRSDEMLLLYSDPPVMYYVFPCSHCANAQDWEAFVSLVASKLPRAGG